MVEISLKNSYAVFSVEIDGKVIGMARLLGDGAMAFYLKDLVILPEYQKQGIGKALMEYIQAYIMDKLEPGWIACLELMSAKGKETFYEKFGFEKRPTEYRGAGMMKMLKRKSELN